MTKFFLLTIIGLLATSAQATYQTDVLEKLLQTYARPVSIFDLSEKPLDLPLMAKRYPTSVFISRHGLDEDNCICFNKDLSVNDICLLSQFEHFDVACCFGSFPYKQAMVCALLQLADNVLIELPEDLHTLLSDFLFKLDAQLLGKQGTNYLIALSRQRPKYLIANAISAGNEECLVVTSRHYALLKTAQATQKLLPGLTLYGYKVLQGNFPDLEVLTQMLKNYPWQPTCACLPWNVLLQGKSICYLERFKEPKSWAKEGLQKSLESLKLGSLKAFQSHATMHYQTIGLHQ